MTIRDILVEQDATAARSCCPDRSPIDPEAISMRHSSSVDRRALLRGRVAAALATAAVAVSGTSAQAGTAVPPVGHRPDPVSVVDGRTVSVVRSARASESDLWRAYEQRDYFALRERLPPTSVRDTDRVRFLRAATEAAFGDHVVAKRTLHQLLARKPDRTIEDLARRLLMREERAEYHYRAALAAIEPLLPKDAAKDEPQLADLRNVALLLEALADVPPQTAERGSGPAAIRRDADGRFPVTINGHAMKLGFDTGANFSFLAASTAKLAGLEIRSVGVSIAASTGGAVGAQIAVTDITLGPSRIRNVVFLVFPDAGLTMPDGFFMPGLLGFPVISALGAIRHSRDGAMHIGVAAPAARRPNMALEGNDVLLRVGFRHEDLLCRLDTGAVDTVFYEPFYRHYPDLFTDSTRTHALTLGGISGARDIPAYKLPSMDIELAARPVHLAGPDVMQQSITRNPEDNYLACNLGMDAFKTFGSYSMDLQHLRLDLQR
jgi:predicted aspartyl protease